jgi:quinol monooxygenase YgiN
VILRILRGRTARGDLEGVLDAVRDDIKAWSAIDAGLVSAQPAFRPADDELDFLLVSTWSDAEAVIARGGEVTKPRGRLGESGRLREAHAGHYELVMSSAHPGTRPGEVIRLSSIPLIPRRSSAFYEHLRKLWEELVDGAGLVDLHVGRRFESDVEQAVVVSVWADTAALDATTSGGFVGGEEMGAFYASEPTIEHFTALVLDEDPAAG